MVCVESRAPSFINSAGRQINRIRISGAHRRHHDVLRLLNKDCVCERGIFDWLIDRVLRRLTYLTRRLAVVRVVVAESNQRPYNKNEKGGDRAVAALGMRQCPAGT